MYTLTLLYFYLRKIWNAGLLIVIEYFYTVVSTKQYHQDLSTSSTTGGCGGESNDRSLDFLCNICFQRYKPMTNIRTEHINQQYFLCICRATGLVWFMQPRCVSVVVLVTVAQSLSRLWVHSYVWMMLKTFLWDNKVIQHDFESYDHLKPQRTQGLIHYSKGST